MRLDDNELILLLQKYNFLNDSEAIMNLYELYENYDRDKIMSFIEISSRENDPLEYFIFENDNLSREQEVERRRNYFKQEKVVNFGGAIKCSKCKGNNIDVYEKQTRSADEPATSYFRCNDCNNNWKQ